MFTKQVINALFALQVIAAVVAQLPANANDGTDVTTNADDYILENRRQFNATLKSYLDEIDTLKNNLENGLKVLDKQNVLLLKTINETSEKFGPLEALSLPSKLCVERYSAELPYADTIKANIESCTTSARGFISTIVSSPNSLYTSLYNYYYINFQNGLNACGKSYINPSSNYTLCVTSLSSSVNAYTISHRNSFATAMQSSDCTLNSRIDLAVSCTYTYYNSALTAIGAVTRLIKDCIQGSLENKPLCENNNATLTAGCPNVVYLEVRNSTIANPWQGFADNQNCLELIFI